MGTICFSTDLVFVEAWHSGTRHLTAAVAIFGLHGAVGTCLKHLRDWSGGEEPTIEAELKAAMDRADALLTSRAFGGEYR